MPFAKVAAEDAAHMKHQIRAPESAQQFFERLRHHFLPARIMTVLFRPGRIGPRTAEPDVYRFTIRDGGRFQIRIALDAG